MNTERVIAYRKQIAALLEAVLEETISARAALNSWPRLGNEDPSIRCVYTMLWFFEADEDRHKEELFYSDLQIINLKEAFEYLKKGESLPVALIQTYSSIKAPLEYSGRWTWQQPIWWLRKQVKIIIDIMETNPYISRKKPKNKLTSTYIKKDPL